jgi:competence protein ComEC
LVLDRYPGGLGTGPGLMLLGLAFGLSLCLWPAWRDRRARWTCLFALFAIAGCGRALLVHAPATPADLAYYNQPGDASLMSVTGTISAEPVVQDRYQRLRVSAENLRSGRVYAALAVHGDLLALVPRFPAYGIGERVVLSGTLTVPPNLAGFDYPSYLARQGVYSYMRFPKAASLGAGDLMGITRPMAGSRRAVREAIQRSVPEPAAALTVGVVTGDRSSIPPKVQQDFQESGTVHVLAISGQNITLLVGFVWLLYSRGAERVRRLAPWAAVLTLIMLVAYTLFTGATPSVIRAAIMGGVLLLAPVFGRRFDPVSAVAVSAFCMAAANPYVLADAGFQLSFLAMLGITLFSPGIYRAIKRRFVPAWLAVALATSFGAQLLTLPLSALLTGRVSFVSPLATLAIDPALLPLMVSGILTGVVGAVAPPLAVIVAPLAWLCAAWMLLMVGWWASLPIASIQLDNVNPLWVVAYYVTLVYALWLVGYSRGRDEGRGTRDEGRGTSQ